MPVLYPRTPTLSANDGSFDPHKRHPSAAAQIFLILRIEGPIAGL